MKADVEEWDVAEYHVNTVVLRVTIPKYQTRGIEDLKGKPLTLELKRKVKKRSLQANAYCWVLAEKIAEKVGNTTKEEIYRRAIHAVGVWDVYTNVRQAIQRIMITWPKQGLGWMVVPLETNGDQQSVILYYGSSVYSTDTMARLLDWLIDEAEGLGIDTATPAEKARMMEDWERARTKTTVAH